MRILPNSQSASHSLFPPQRMAHEPPLLLPAPKIAGLLGEGPHPNPSPTGGRGAKAEHRDDLFSQKESETTRFLPFSRVREKGAGDEGTFTFTDPRLATLNTEQHQKFSEAAQTLLNVALRFTIDELNEEALRAAQVLFHRKLTGHSPKRPMTPTAFKAEGDADMLDVMLNYEKRRDDLDSTFDRRFAEGMATLRSGKAANHA